MCGFVGRASKLDFAKEKNVDKGWKSTDQA